MSITTKTGDNGQTSLFGGVRVDKDHIRIECNGLIDELNTRIGLLMTEMGQSHKWYDKLLHIQRKIMIIMSHIATPENCPKENKKPHPKQVVADCEHWIEELLKVHENEKLAFVLPGGNRIASYCHFARTGTRTVERKLITLHKIEPVPAYILQFFNRLSDFFYLLAITSMKESGEDVEKFMLFPSQKRRNNNSL